MGALLMINGKVKANPEMDQETKLSNRTALLVFETAITGEHYGRMNNQSGKTTSLLPV